ncbi:MAG: hypothetical protein ACFFD4_16685 [Candidatus Odinarchaeota archaeon]
MVSNTASLSEQRPAADGLYLLYPNGGVSLSGNVTIQWHLSSDYWNEYVRYSVYYSPDNGTHWILLADSVNESSLEWETHLYETSGNSFLVKVVAHYKEWEDKEVISDGTFSINNNLSASNFHQFIPLLGLVVLLLVTSSVSGFLLYKVKTDHNHFSDYSQVSKMELLTIIKYKVTVGLAKATKAENPSPSQSLGITHLDIGTIPISRSIIEYFPSEISNELRSTIKGRTVLTLIEIAYQPPDSRNPANLAKSLSIPPSTVSKEIKRLVNLQYIDVLVSEQVLQDGRYRSFKISPKGFTFLSKLNEVLDATIDRLVKNSN